MFKKMIAATAAVFILWSIIDFLVHGILLQEIYQETMHLWRPEDQMLALLMSAVTLFFGAAVVLIYSFFVAPKSLATGVKFGAVLGIGIGAMTGLGSFSYMPIPLCLAGAWFAVMFAKLTVAGLVVGRLVSEHVTPIGMRSM